MIIQMKHAVQKQGKTEERDGEHSTCFRFSPVDPALDCTFTDFWDGGPGVRDGSPDAGHSRVPSLVDFIGLDLDFEDLTASVVSVLSYNKALPAAIAVVVDGDNVSWSNFTSDDRAHRPVLLDFFVGGHGCCRRVTLWGEKG